MDDLDLQIQKANRGAGRSIPRTRRKNKTILIKRLERMFSETSDIDSGAIQSDEVLDISDSNKVVLAVQGTEDWLSASILRDRITSGQKTIQRDGTWITPSNFDLADWCSKHLDHYTFFGHNSVLGTPSDGSIVNIRSGRNKIEVELIGSHESVDSWIKLIDSMFKKAQNLIEWVYNARGHNISVPLNYRKAIRSAYPWIDSSYVELNEYLDEYINSDSSVLILIGPPGSGKTTFIKNLIYRSKGNAKVAYDPKVMTEDDFFAGFIDDDSKFLVMEDADDFLQSRTEGNSMMHKFLNVSDGLISAADKKLVFSTNLPNVSDIDEALMRPGRCFDVIQFRKLTRDEAQAVLNECNSDRIIPDGSSFSLAELFSTLPSGEKLARRKIGFIS